MSVERGTSADALSVAGAFARRRDAGRPTRGKPSSSEEGGRRLL